MSPFRVRLDVGGWVQDPQHPSAPTRHGSSRGMSACSLRPLSYFPLLLCSVATADGGYRYMSLDGQHDDQTNSNSNNSNNSGIDWAKSMVHCVGSLSYV